MKENIKNCKIIYNPIYTSFSKKIIVKMNNITANYQLNGEFLEGIYQGKLIKLVKTYDEYNTLLLIQEESKLLVKFITKYIK